MSKVYTAKQSVLQRHDCPVTAVPFQYTRDGLVIFQISNRLAPGVCTHLHKELG